MTSIKDLEKLGGFVPDAPVKKEVPFYLAGPDVTVSIFVKRLGIGAYEALFLNDKDERSRTARAISEAVTLGEKGEQRLTFDQAYKLDPQLAREILTAFNEVNSPKKPSAPATDS